MKIVSEQKETDPHQNIVEVAERLFSQIGFQKTTVADIARELRMSPANVYRFFSAKAEINEAVGRRLLTETEASLEAISTQPGSASEKLRSAIAALEKANAQRFVANRKLHELLETAFNENWPIVQDHSKKLNKVLTNIISEGNSAGEFHVSDCELAAILVRSACIRFCHPRLMVECAQEPEPTLDQMVDFCLVALG
ncbi:transcriptional regulator, TetR family [Methylocella silvestris BL2]|uniref:Transcriptional regulator, TetR family n=1 Tax=Methylocella silvestris (strain DSM 15510 / CIP 108128 / LMG 27833 / NCIMB 13906 / BL2) TaxID=395965 RepID=B8EL83_METSB|nr:TetR/AcrR family transcriptional regulator [Methylocella silvestris]ACK49078.1 transcriptional regulator, TetR family [Methylocella silvestris BL2]